MSNSGTRVRRQLPSHPSSAGEARRMVRRVLADAGRDDLVEPAQLLVSEVVTNALVHSATPIDVSMAATEDGVLVEVGDGSQHIPHPRHYAPTASTGRGLALLDRTADAWGVVPGIRGKTVWFQLSSTDYREAPSDDDPPGQPDATVLQLRRRSDSTADSVTVSLLNVPLLLHAAWQQHAEAVLREHLLAGLDSERDGDPFALHAAATDALAVLAEHIPAPDIGTEPDELMSAAVDPRVSAARIDVEVARDCVPHFGSLDAVLDAGTTMAEEGQLLVPVVQPEMRMLRRWLCDQVAAQASGGTAPVPWPPPQVLRPPRRRDLTWDPATVTQAPSPTVAADDTDLIIAVNRGALDLLGYDKEERLLGRRLITIIPQRYRQAHLAGFALHLLTGRGPLLERPVEVPALRADGTEVAVKLDVEVHRPTSGRAVFVATLRELA